MAYTKQNWENGDVITADKLNHMEDGIAEGGSGGGIFVVNFTYDEQVGKYTADKTIQEIETATLSGPVIGNLVYDGYPGNTHVLGSPSPLQFTGISVTGNTGIIDVLGMEIDDDTDEPTGFWTQNAYVFNVTNPVAPESSTVPG